MRRGLKFALAATAIAVGTAATPAYAAVTVAVDGRSGYAIAVPNLRNQKQRKPRFWLVSEQFERCQCHVHWQHLTTMGITNGFAQVNDDDPKNPSWNSLIINPTQYDFTQMKFAVQLVGAGSFDVYYLLSGSGSTRIWPLATRSSAHHSRRPLRPT